MITTLALATPETLCLPLDASLVHAPLPSPSYAAPQAQQPHLLPRQHACKQANTITTTDTIAVTIVAQVNELQLQCVVRNVFYVTVAEKAETRSVQGGGWR